MKYVIIGNSAAGIGAVEGIRQIDQDGEITIISSEPYHTYSRPLISYLLLGKTTEEKMKYRGESFYDKNHCNVLLSRQVTKIDPAHQTVTLDDGSQIAYDRLLIGSGSSPFVPPIAGLDRVKHQFTFMKLDDAKALQQALTPVSKVLIVGAGLIGLKCAEGISDKAGSITVVDLAPNILSSILDHDASKIVKEHLEEKGIRFSLAQSIKNVSEDTAFLESGETIPFDVLVLAVGVRPNTGLLKEIGGHINHGVIVNSRMETSIDNIYAAGDCTESFDIASAQKKILAILPNAYRQGECAGINMAGSQCVFDTAIPMNAIGFFGLHIMTAGSYDGEVYIKSDEKTYKKLFYKDDRLKGFILIGEIAKAGIYTSLIREETPLSNIDFDLVCERPGLMAFSKEDRKIKLGGAQR